jgi:hypothetical protein
LGITKRTGQAHWGKSGESVKCARGAGRSRFNAGVNESEYERSCAALGVESGVTLEALERAFLKRNFALIRSGTLGEREQLRQIYEALAAHLKAQAPVMPPAAAGRAPLPSGPPVAPTYQMPVPDSAQALRNPLSFDSWLVNLTALPLVTLIALLANLSPLGFLLKGFHIWTHEFGHATVAWLTGKRALPLPFGWTNVESEKSTFVYLGVLFLLGVFFTVGWKERKIWPMLIALAVAPLQFYLTWRLPEYRADLWRTFAGVGGEFYLSAALMGLFYFQLPEKFKWSVCRYFFLFIGASSFLNIFLFWRQVRLGTEAIPWGSLVNGEEDGGGDMNILRDDYHWSNHDIIGTYTHLGNFCVAAVLVVYVIFALRLDRPAGRLMNSLWPE